MLSISPISAGAAGVDYLLRQSGCREGERSTEERDPEPSDPENGERETEVEASAGPADSGADYLLRSREADGSVRWWGSGTDDVGVDRFAEPRDDEVRARYAGAPWFGVSSRAAADALAAEADGELEEAAEERAASGMDPLADHLAGLAEGADGLRLANLVHQATATAQRLCGLQVRRALSLSLSPEFAELVAREKAALTALQGQNATWRQTLGERSARLEGLRALGARVDGRAPRIAAPALPQRGGADRAGARR